MTRRSTTHGVLALLLLSTACAGCGSSSSDEDSGVPPYENLEVGLSAEQRLEVWHLTEGSDLFPLVLLQALEDSAAGVPFIESMPRFGFLPSEKNEANPFALPVGWTVDTPEQSPNQLPYVGINCAACHTGQIELRGKRLRIDGAPNMVDLEAFGQAVRDSLVTALADPGKTLELIQSLSRALHPEAGDAAVLLIPRDTRLFLKNLEASVAGESERSAADATEDSDLGRDLACAVQEILRGELDSAAEDRARAVSRGSEELSRHVATILELFERFGPIVRNRLGFALRAIHAIDRSPAAGPGRDDPWGIIRNLLFETPTPLTAPTSIPSLFGFDEFEWFHADGNTTSVLQRNVAQAVALGAYVDLDTGGSTLVPGNVKRLEELWTRVRAPSWPEGVLGEIDRDRARRGEALFNRPTPGADGHDRPCVACHQSPASKLFALDLIGTDPNRAASFAEPLAGLPFDRQIQERVGAVIEVALEAAGIAPETAGTWEYRAPEWRTTEKYVTRRLSGVWATAPYLHNGSVPTLYHLLLPAAERPSRFPLGHREYDPERVGYTTAVESPVFILDVSVAGNSNAGHEFGTGLGEEERRDLVEYLKTLY